MIRTVKIVDYGIGNLHSVARALDKIGARPELISDAESIAKADALLLPGVGAFEPCISNLRSSGLVEPMQAFIRTGRPFLGICVGMQLLFEYSTEFGRHPGLGVIKGSVDAIPPLDAGGARRKVPHIGWGELQLPDSRMSWDSTLLASLEPGAASAYFVHSYSGTPADRRDLLAEVDHEGFRVCAAVQKDNVTGMQFHPEKSGVVGLTILERFVADSR